MCVCVCVCVCACVYDPIHTGFRGSNTGLKFSIFMKFSIFCFLIASEGYRLSGTILGTGRIHFHRVSSKSNHRRPRNQKNHKQNTMTTSFFRGFLKTRWHARVWGILEGYLGDIWRIFGGHLDEIYKTFGGKLADVKRRLEWKHLIFKHLIFNILIFRKPL